MNSDKIITSKSKKNFDNPMIDELKKSETYRKTMVKNSLSSMESRQSKNTLDGDGSPKLLISTVRREKNFDKPVKNTIYDHKIVDNDRGEYISV